MNHGSLFSGIGGFDLASEWMGWENKFHCEWNPFGQKILKHYWPKSESYGDITTTDFTIWNGKLDILTGGFPCQPYSQAGKRLGKEDERHLWPEMLRAIREIQPRWVVGENVFGLVNWNGGMVFHEVQADLEAEGYEVQPYVLPAVAVNAPHRRDRVWFVAHRHDDGLDQRHGGYEVEPSQGGVDALGDVGTSDQYGHDTNPDGIRCDNGSNNREERHISHDKERNTEESKTERRERVCGVGKICGDGATADTTGNGDSQRTIPHRGTDTRGAVWPIGSDKLHDVSCGDVTDANNAIKSGQCKRPTGKGKLDGCNSRNTRATDWDQFPTQPPVCGGDDGLPTELDGITFPKWRQESVKAYGNAIVPQVAHQIFKTIEAYEKINLR